jgi:hypothetical protein
MWGMTELSPLGSLGVPSRQQIAEGLDLQTLVNLKVGTIKGLSHLFVSCAFQSQEVGSCWLVQLIVTATCLPACLPCWSSVV